MDYSEIKTRVKAVQYWWHSIPLPYGIVTSGHCKDTLNTWRYLGLPADLTGKRVLDLGCADGFYSFGCERRGASVVAIDNLERMKRPQEVQYQCIGNAGFETVKEILNSKVEFINMDVHDITPEMGKFDIILCLGLFYHLKNPILFLERVSEVCKGKIYIETESILPPLEFQSCVRYCAGESFNHDPTNWFIPSYKALKLMLQDTGFKNVCLLYQSKNLLLRVMSNYQRIIVEAESEDF